MSLLVGFVPFLLVEKLPLACHSERSGLPKPSLILRQTGQEPGVTRG